MRSKLIAILFAFFLGSFGIHQFYLGNNKKGILYLIFCWTIIPSILGIIDAISYLLMSKDSFNSKFN